MGRKLKRKLKSAKTPEAPIPTDSCTFKIENPVIERKCKPNKPILITNRLFLSPFRNDDEFVDGDTELQLNIRPRTYFVSGLCYSCSRSCDDLKYPCESCYMIAYCSPEHRLRDVSAHVALCVVLTRIERNGGLSLAKGLEAPDFRNFRVELLRTTELMLGRSLQPREREILLYPKLCRICHGSENLERCPVCRVVYFCQRGHALGHEKHCEQFRVFARILEMENASGFVAPRLPTSSLLELPTDFDSLVREIFQVDYERIDCASYAALSQTATPVLTVLHVIRKSAWCTSYRKRKLLKIHVIGAELQFECANLGLWEKLFLHLLPDVEGLRLEFYGPELQIPTNLVTVLERPELCSNCCSSNRKLELVFHCGKLYHEVQSDKPEIVCLFNPGLYRVTGYANQDTWPKTIDKFCKYGVPVIVTSYTEIELPLDLARICEVQEVEVEEEPQRNPFASLRPERNFVSDDIAPLIYKNYFVAVVRGIISSF